MKLLQSMSAKDYHARTEISASMIKKCDPPARLHNYLTTKTPPTEAMLFGTAVDSVVFTGSHEIPVKPLGMSFATTEGKQWKRDNAELLKLDSAGVPTNMITAEMDNNAYLCRDSIGKHKAASEILKSGRNGIACVVTDPDLWVGCRCLYDWVTDVGLVQGDPIVDLKTTAEGNASPERFAREILKHGYHLQAAWYLRLWNLYHEDDSEKRTGFSFIVVETAPPFLVAVYGLSPDFLAAAEIECLRRAEMIRDCQESRIWPGYPGVTTIDKPRWMRTDLESLVFD